jgi:hypothetical protein
MRDARTVHLLKCQADKVDKKVGLLSVEIVCCAFTILAKYIQDRP